MCRLLSLLIVIVALCAAVITPNLVIKQVEKCSYVIPSQSNIKKTVTAAGVLESIDSREIYIPTALVPKKVEVSIGDFVKKGDTIAKIDLNTTKQILNNSIMATASRFTPDEGSTEIINGILDTFGMNLSDFGDAQAVFSQIKSIEKTTKTVIPEKIISPIEGVVTALQLQQGNLCQPTGAVAKIDDLSNMKAVINIAENNSESVKLGQSVLLDGVGFNGKKVSGYISKIYPIVTRNNNGANFVTAEVTINKPNFILKPGYSVTASIVVEEGFKSCALPYDVIDQDINNKEYVYVLEKGRAVKRYISTGIEMPEQIEVIDGIGTDNIILRSNNHIEDGNLVLLKGEENVY